MSRTVAVGEPAGRSRSRGPIDLARVVGIVAAHAPFTEADVIGTLQESQEARGEDRPAAWTSLHGEANGVIVGACSRRGGGCGVQA